MSDDLFGDVSTVDTGERSDFDFYETPAWMTRSLLRHVPAIKSRYVLECCSGRDAITRVLREAGCDVVTNDLDRRHSALTHMDATKPDNWPSRQDAYDWVVTNPPFKEAFEILQNAVRCTTIGVALLVRKTFLEPTRERGPWLQEHPPTIIIGLPRYSFRGTGSDSVSCDWMVWLRKPPFRHGQTPIVIDAKAQDL